MTAAEALDVADRIRAEGVTLYRLSGLAKSQWGPAYGAYRKVEDAADALESLAAKLALHELKASRKAAA